MDYEALLKDRDDVRKKLDASRARNQSLSAETKSLKAQISILLEKGRHDDELVDALLVKRNVIYSVYLLLCVNNQVVFMSRLQRRLEHA